jgi:hypothetical protein
MNSQHPDKEEAFHLRALVRQIQSGHCVLVLGPGASTATQEGREIPLTNLLANELSQLHQISSTAGLNCNDLRHVSQVLLNQEKNHWELEERVIEFYSRFAGKTSEFHRNMAALPFQFCITTTPDDFLYEAFVGCEEKAKKPTKKFYNFYSQQPGDVPEPSETAPLVYHLYGHVDEPHSLVITENDLIDFLTRVIRNEPRLPETIRSKLNRGETTFLFVDLGFKNWYLRALLWALGLHGHDHQIGTAIEDPEFFAQSRYHQTTVYYSTGKLIEFHQESLDEFAKRLRRAYDAWAQQSRKVIAEAPAGAPCVFLSYANEDQEEVIRLEDKLMRVNIAVWRDKQNLRIGDNWALVLKQVITKQVDYVVVFQTTRMIQRVEGVFNDEIREALGRQRRMQEGIRFVLPVRMGDIQDKPLLKDLHSQRVDTEEGFQALTTAIKEDWKERERRKTV